MKYMSDIIIQLYRWCITTNKQQENSFIESYCIICQKLDKHFRSTEFSNSSSKFICKF